MKQITVYSGTHPAADARTPMKLVLSGDTSAITAPGQFVNICSCPDNSSAAPSPSATGPKKAALMLLVQGGGRGHPGSWCAACPARSWTCSPAWATASTCPRPAPDPVLAGGGIGIAPLYGLARRMLDTGVTPTVALGFRTAKDAFYLEEFARSGLLRSPWPRRTGAWAPGALSPTASGPLPECDYVLRLRPPSHAQGRPSACLSSPAASSALRPGWAAALAPAWAAPCHTVDGYKRVCKDGPILYKEEIVW